MCQVHTGAYVSLLAPGKTDYTALPPKKDSLRIRTTDASHLDNRKKKQRKEKIKGKKEERRKGEKKKRKRKGKERKVKVNRGGGKRACLVTPGLSYS